MFNIKKILKELNNIPKVKYPITYSKVGILFYNYSNIVLNIGIILLLLAYVFGLLFKYFQYQFFIILTLVTFLGNKNVVIFTVYSMSLTFFNQLGGLDNLWTSFNQTNLTLSSVNLITLFSFAFFIGLILGCFILNSNISQYRDKVSLLKLTLKILSIT